MRKRFLNTQSEVYIQSLRDMRQFFINDYADFADCKKGMVHFMDKHLYKLLLHQIVISTSLRGEIPTALIHRDFSEDLEMTPQL